MRSKLSSEQIANIQTKKMVLAQDLTQKQQQQVQAIILEEAKFRKAKMEERKAKKANGELEKPSAKKDMPNRMNV